MRLWQKHQTITLACQRCGTGNVRELPYNMRRLDRCLFCGENFCRAGEDEMNLRMAALHDSRVLNWSKIGDARVRPVGPYYVAGVLSMGWTVARVDPEAVDPCLNPPGWASHWAPDLLGLPFTG